MSGIDISGIELTCGPTHLKSRILVRNLPPCTRQELSLLCFPYGRILGSLVIDTCGYIQFTSLIEAKRAIESLNLFIFKSKVLQVSNATPSSLNSTFSGTAPRIGGGSSGLMWMKLSSWSGLSMRTMKTMRSMW